MTLKKLYSEISFYACSMNIEHSTCSKLNLF